MPPPLFPTFVGVTFPVKRTSLNRSIVSGAVSGKRTSVSLMSWPLYRYDLAFSVLHFDSPFDYQLLQGFINGMGGSYGNFYYNDPYFNSATDVEIGVSDGANLQYQLASNLGGFLEPVQSPQTIAVYADAVLINPIDYTVLNGIITLTAPAANGAVITWTGTFYQLCHMLEDQQEFAQFDGYRAEVTRLSFVTDKL